MRNTTSALIGVAFLMWWTVCPKTVEAQETLAVRNARLYPVTGPVIPSGVLVVERGKIRVKGRS